MNQKTRDKHYLRVGARVEHVLVFCEQSLHGMGCRLIGRARIAASNLLTALVYNMCRYEQLLWIQIK